MLSTVALYAADQVGPKQYPYCTISLTPLLVVSCLVLMDRAAAPARRTSPLLLMVLRMRARTRDDAVDGATRANRTSQYNAPSGVMKPVCRLTDRLPDPPPSDLGREPQET